MSKNQKHPIPVGLNLLFSLYVVVFSTVLLIWSREAGGYGLLAVSAAYGLVMTTGYAVIHEAEHNLLHPNTRVNVGIGVLVSFFFPAPYHLLRQGHLGHHMRNRSDDEAFDFYFEGENPVWKFLQLYGTMLGFFWIVAFSSNFLAVFFPWILKPKFGSFDRPTEAFLEALNPRYHNLIRIEAAAILIFHVSLIYLFNIPVLNWFLTLFGFGFLWSAMQYVHHFGTNRDVRFGAKNLSTLRWLDALWMNHNWHLNHHLKPTVPWIHLPTLSEQGEKEKRDGLLISYLKMWRGPRYSDERVQNAYAGKIIK